MADEEDRAAAGPHLAHEMEDLRRLGQRQRRRRLVEDDQIGLLVDGAGDRDALALAAGQLADDRVRREHLRGEADLAHQPLGLADFLVDLEEAEAAGELAAHEDVADDRLLDRERPVLEHGLDAGLARPRRVPAGHRLAAHDDLAAGRRDHAGEDLDQRRLAGAVVADQADDLADVDVQADAAERVDVAVGLRDVAELDQVLGHSACLPAGRCRPGCPGRHADCDA